MKIFLLLLSSFNSRADAVVWFAFLTWHSSEIIDVHCGAE